MGQLGDSERDHRGGDPGQYRTGEPACRRPGQQGQRRCHQDAHQSQDGNRLVPRPRVRAGDEREYRAAQAVEQRGRVGEGLRATARCPGLRELIPGRALGAQRRRRRDRVVRGRAKAVAVDGAVHRRPGLGQEVGRGARPTLILLDAHDAVDGGRFVDGGEDRHEERPAGERQHVEDHQDPHRQRSAPDDAHEAEGRHVRGGVGGRGGGVAAGSVRRGAFPACGRCLDRGPFDHAPLPVPAGSARLECRTRKERDLHPG